MIVAHVLSSFQLGGQERVALELTRAQRRHGDRVLAVALQAGGPLLERFREAGADVHEVPRWLRLDPTLPARLARLFSAHHVDVAHTHNPQALVYGAPGARLACAAVVHTKHGKNPDRRRRRWLRRRAASLVDSYVAVTPTLAEIARREHECNPARIAVVDNGIDVATYGPDPAARADVRRELGIPSDAWVVGSVGRLAPEKDHALLLEAMVPLLAAGAYLLLVGDGPSRSALEDAAAGHPRVLFAGVRDDIPRMLTALDVFALSSRSEGLPLVLLEALASELAVVATDVGGVADLIDSSTGVLVPAGHADRLAAALATLQQNPQNARALGRAGRARVLERHTAERMAARYADLYRKALVRRRLLAAGALAGALPP